MPLSVRIDFGDWLPTLYLRYKGGLYSDDPKVLQQRMRRRVKHFPETGTAYTRYEYRWDDIPTIGLMQAYEDEENGC